MLLSCQCAFFVVLSWGAIYANVRVWDLAVWVVAQNVLPSITLFTQYCVSVIFADAAEASYDIVVLGHVFDRWREAVDGGVRRRRVGGSGGELEVSMRVERCELGHNPSRCVGESSREMSCVWVIQIGLCLARMTATSTTAEIGLKTAE
jgi:hypothetical protein